MSAEAGLATAGSGFLSAEFAVSHGAVMLGLAFFAASTGFDVHHLILEGIAEPILGM